MEKKRLIKILIAGGLLLFGFLYPVFMGDTLKEIIWKEEEESALVIVALVGSIFFLLSGLIASKIIKEYANEKTLMPSVVVAMFFLFGISYNAIAVINGIKKGFGILGSYVIESEGLSFVVPLASIGLVITSLVIIYICLSLFIPGINEKVVAVKKISIVKDEIKKVVDPIVEKETLIEPNPEIKPEVKPEVESEKTPEVRKEEIFDTTHIETEKKADDIPVEKETKVETESPTEMSSISRLKSTMRASTSETNVEESDRFKPAGDL